MALSQLGETLLNAYTIALNTQKAHHFTVVETASIIIRLEGHEGRMAVQKAKREYTNQKAQNPSNDERATTTMRKLVFGKKNEPSQPVSFNLKHITRGTPKPEPEPAKQPRELPTNILAKTVLSEEKAAHVAEDEQPENDIVEAEKPMAKPLNKGEMELLGEMKPAAIGKEFGIERLRSTADILEIEYQESHSATALATAILNHIKKHGKK